MIKLLQSVIALFIISFLFLTSASQVNALQICTSATPTTNPTVILENTPQATFTIDIVSNNEPGVDEWWVEFQCTNYQYSYLDSRLTTLRTKVKTIRNGDGKTISATINNNGIGCEFQSTNNPIKIKVKAIKTDKSEVDYCEASYNVKKYVPECKISIVEKDIIFTNPLRVSGEVKVGDSLFLFFDDNAVDIQDNVIGRAKLLGDLRGDLVSTPNFGPKTLPPELITPGFHSVSLRQKIPLRIDDVYIPDPGSAAKHVINLTKPEKDFFGSALCSVTFTVGTKDNPGSAVAADINLLKGCTAEQIKEETCTSAAGQEVVGCTDNPANPAIATAIGCIHTSPVEFVKDFIKFIVAISGGFAFLMMLLGAYQMLTSAGNPESLNAGRERLTSAVIGLLFVIFAILLMQVIGVGFLALPGLSK